MIAWMWSPGFVSSITFQPVAVYWRLVLLSSTLAAQLPDSFNPLWGKLDLSDKGVTSTSESLQPERSGTRTEQEMQFRGSCCSSAVRPLLDLVQSDPLGPAWWLHAVAARSPVTKVAGTNTHTHCGVDLILLWLRDPDGTKVPWSSFISL